MPAPLLARFRLLLVAVFLLGTIQTAPAAYTVTFKGGNITKNTSEDGANYSVTVFGNKDSGYGSLGDNEVVFYFAVGSGENGKISEIYFQNGTLLSLSKTNINNVGTVDFTGGSANPGNLPGGKNAPVVAFQAHDGFVADVTKNTTDAIAAGESSGIKFELISGKTYADVVNAIIQGTSKATTSSSGEVSMNGGLRIGIHVRDAVGTQSDSFVNDITVVPVPPTMALALSGLAGVGLFGLCRARRARAGGGA